MARKCELTGRKVSTGHKKQHKRGSSGSGGAWNYKAPKTKRIWQPNLRKIRVMKANGPVETITVSMKAYKKIRNEGSFKGYSLAYNVK